MPRTSEKQGLTEYYEYSENDGSVYWVGANMPRGSVRAQCLTGTSWHCEQSIADITSLYGMRLMSTDSATDVESARAWVKSRCEWDLTV